MVKIGVIGCGYWGPNLIRNFRNSPQGQVVICCDQDEQRLERMRNLFPEVVTTTDYTDLLTAGLDAVAIATPVWTHFPLAKSFLEAGMHVFVEKPITASSAECLELIDIARCRELKLMVGHTFEYTTAVNKIRDIVQNGELGDIMYISSTRVNLGLFQPDINVIWDLAPHDLSIISYVLGKEPLRVNSQGKAHFKEDIEDVAMTTLDYGDGTIAFLHNSWLDPNKIRTMVFVGSHKMLVYDDISTNEKIKIYDKGVEKPTYYNSFAEFQFSYRYGDIYIPRIEETEALGSECQHFLDCILNNKTPRSDGYSGLRVVRIIEAANRSLKLEGKAVALQQNGALKTTGDARV